MDRIEAYELYEAENESGSRLLPLNLTPDRFSPQSSIPRPVTKEQALVDEIWRYFDKAIAFPRLMNIVKTKGYQFTFECFKEVKQGAARSPVSLFLWKVKHCKVSFKDV